MPNWCDNSVHLTSSKENIDALAAVLENEDDRQVFQHLRPRPEDQEENWYDWNINHWGTKWEISLIDWSREDDETIWISFETAWSPPAAIYEYLHEQGWRVNAVYHESGMAFCGQWVDGDDDYYEYSMDDFESIDCLPDEVKEFTGLVDYYQQLQEEREMEEETEAYEATVTEWYPISLNPDKIGFYEIKETENWPFTKFCHWNGKKWTYDGKKPKFKIHSWRGLKEPAEVDHA